MHPCHANRMAYGQIPLYPGFILANESRWKSREDRVTLLCNYSPTLGRTRDRPVIRCRLSSTALTHRHYRPHLFSSSPFLSPSTSANSREKRKKKTLVQPRPRASHYPADYDRNYRFITSHRSDANDAFFFMPHPHCSHGSSRE